MKPPRNMLYHAPHIGQNYILAIQLFYTVKALTYILYHHVFILTLCLCFVILFCPIGESLNIYSQDVVRQSGGLPLVTTRLQQPHPDMQQQHPEDYPEQ